MRLSLNVENEVVRARDRTQQKSCIFDLIIFFDFIFNFLLVISQFVLCDHTNLEVKYKRGNR